MSVFDQYRREAWPYEYACTLHVKSLSGGVPSDPKVAEGWIRSKFTETDDRIRDRVMEAVVERRVQKTDAAVGENGVTVVSPAQELDDAIEQVDSTLHCNGFKRTPSGVLYIEGRQVKAAIKEGASVAVAGDKLKAKGWGKTNKGLQSFLAEHVCVVEDEIVLGVTEPTGVHQRFIHKILPGRGKISAIHYEEYVENVDVAFTVRTDFEFDERDWAMIWLTGGEQGLGASRSQGFGRYSVEQWDRID